MLFGILKKVIPLLEKLDLNRLLIEACRKNDEYKIKRLLKMRANVNVRDENGESVLQIVYNNNNIEMVKYLLDNGANINMQYNTGATLLFEACRKNDFEFVKYLINKIERVDEKNFNKDDCELLDNLIYKISRFVKKDEEYGRFELNIKDVEGNTPLFMAVKNDNKEMVKYLLKHGASIKTKNLKGENAIIYASRLGKKDIVDFFVKNYKEFINKRDSGGRTALIHACIRGDIDAVKLLLENDALLNIVDKNQRTAIMYVCKRYDYDIAKLLIKKYKEVIENSQELGYLDEQNLVEIKMALFCAVIEGNIRILKQLLEIGDENSKGGNGVTLLMCAIENKRTNIALFLLGQYVDITVKDENGLTALMYAIKYKQMEVFLHLIEKCHDINDSDDKGKTLLMYAVHANESNMVGILIKKGADVNKRDNDGETALMKAYKYGFCEICDLLEKNGAENMVIGFEQSKILGKKRHYNIQLEDFFAAYDETRFFAVRSEGLDK